VEAGGKMKSGRNPNVKANAPKSQTCEECGSPAKRISKERIVGKPVATYKCKNGHTLKVSL
jgi:hypothetical protein